MDAEQLEWQYKITLYSMTSNEEYMHTTNDTFYVIEGLPPSDYDVSITPVLRDLGLSGEPTSTG